MEKPKSETPFFKLLKYRKIQVIIVVIIILLTAIILTTREPEVEIRAIKLKSYSVSETWILFEITLKVTNHNIIGGTLNSLEANIYVNGDYIGHARTTEKFDINAMGDSTIRVDLRIDNLPSPLIPIKIRAKGTANVSVFFLSWDEQIDKEVFG